MESGQVSPSHNHGTRLTRLHSTIPDTNISPGSAPASSHPTTAFQLEKNIPIKYLSFSQRRLVGFRSQFEFDKKRLLYASKQEIQVVGYDEEENVYHLLTHRVAFNQEIRFCSFLQDQNSQFVFVIIADNDKNSTDFKILKLKRNMGFPEICEAGREALKEKIQNQIKEGKLKPKNRNKF